MPKKFSGEHWCCRYFPQFYFFADIVATLSILLDIKWVVDLSEEAGDLERTAAVSEMMMNDSDSLSCRGHYSDHNHCCRPLCHCYGLTYLFFVAQASRIAARAARLLKLQRLVKVRET